VLFWRKRVKCEIRVCLKRLDFGIINWCFNVIYWLILNCIMWMKGLVLEEFKFRKVFT
jgi:hypothetical protein